MYGSRTFKQTTQSRFDTRYREEWHGERFYEHMVQICREDDILDRMRNDFSKEVGMKPSPLGTFSQITSYYRVQVPDDILQEYRSDDGRTVDWLGFIERCQTDLSISFDLDEMLGKFYQWLYYNVLESLHEIFDQEYEVDLESLQTVCKKASVNLKNEEISRIFLKYSKNMYLDYNAIADIYDEKKRDRKFQAKYYPTQHVTKNDIFTALKNRLKIRSCSLRELFGLVTMTGNDEISLYDATRILVSELNTPGYDFTEAVHKYVINHMVAGSKTQVSFKSMQDEFEKTFNIDHNQSEIAYRENCIKKMLDKIALKLVQKEIDLKTLDRDEFDYKEMTDFLKVDLNIFNQEPPKKIEKLDLSKHPLLAQLSNKEAVEEMIRKQESKDRPPEEPQVETHEITEKEHQIFKDTMDYIMDQKEIITVEEFIELMQEYLGKQKHCMEVLYRLKQYIKRRHCSLFESFNTYKSFEKYKNTEIHPEEFLKVLISIGFDITENSLYKCLACFEYSSVDKIDYTVFCEAVEHAINPRAKGLKNLRKFKTKEQIYEYLAEQCEIYFPLGSLCQDHDYDKSGTIEIYQLERILRKGASEMTEGDLAFLLSTLNDGYDRVDIHEFIDNVNFYIQDRDKYQRLETRIPEKMLEPLDKADRDVKNAKKIRRLDRKASMGKRSAGKKTERSEIDSQEREETSELANLKEEIAKKIRKNNLDTQKFYKECKSRGRGTVEDRDFEDIIVKDIGFKATNKELDILCDHYGKEVKKGYIDYRSFDDDIYDINKRAKQKTKWRTAEVDPPKDFSPDKSKIDGEERKEEEKVQELEYSYRPSDNMPDDIRYSMKNTVVGRFPDSRTQRKHKVKIAEYILQDIIKATYTRDCLVGDAFRRFSTTRSGNLSEAALKEGFLTYGIHLEPKIMRETYRRLRGKENELTNDLLDLTIEDNSKSGIEELQKEVMEIIDKGIKNLPQAPIKDSFLKMDFNQDGETTFEKFKKVIKIYVPKLRTLDIMFLAKRYCIQHDDCVLYEKFLEEIDLLDRGINPLMSWAENLSDTIVKAIISNNTDFEELFLKYAPGKKYITELQFLEAMRSISVNSKFDSTKISKFYYFIDDDKSGEVSFKEMEGIIKTHCTKTPQKLMDEILDEIKLQMDDDITVSTVYKTLDKYSRKELIDNASFMRALKHDLKFHLDQIDLDFTSRLYRDKKNKEFIRYSTFMDDLRQKFELTETYIVPGAKRKAPTNTADVLISTKFTKQDYENQKKEEALKDILSDLKKELYDKEIDIEREFKKYNPDGFVRESEFREVFSNYRLQFSPNEVDILIDRYVNTFDENIDTNVMCDHLHDLDDFVNTKSIFDSSREPARKSITYKIAKKLEKLKITRKAIRYIERTDVHHDNYLSFDQLKKAFWKANFKLSSAQLEELLRGVSQDDEGNYNYPQMFRIMFGDRYKQRIVVMDRSVPSLKEIKHSKRDETQRQDSKRDDRGRSLNQRSRSGKRHEDDRSERSHRSRKSRDERKRSRSRLGSSLKRSTRRGKSSARRSSRRSGSRSRSHKRHESRSKSKGRSVRFSKSKTRDGSRRRHATSKSAGRSRSGKRRDAGKMVRYIGRKIKQSKYDYINHLKQYAGDDIDFILSERQIFKMTFAAGIKLSKEDKKEFVKDMGRENFTVEEFLNQCELKTDEFRTLGLAEEAGLTEQEEELVKKNLATVGTALEEEKKEFENVFNLKPYEKQLDFSEFKYGLLNEINSECSNMANHSKTLMLMKKFLVTDPNRDSKIDVKHLYTHLFPAGDGRQEIKTKMNCITDFVEYLKSNPDVNIEEEFMEDMSHAEFRDALDDIGHAVSKQDFDKLAEAFSNAKNPDRVFKNVIKRNINMLAPEILNLEKGIKKKDAQALVDNLEKKTRTTLIKINEHLKSQRTDTFTFFQYCDENGDGLLTEDEFCKGIMHWKIPGMKDSYLRDVFKAINPNNDEHLSLGEISLYIEGAKQTSKQRELSLEKDLERDMQQQIDDIFAEFKDSDNNVTKEGIKKILSAYNIPPNVVSDTLEELKTDAGGTVNKKSFGKFMTNFLKNQILQVENDINELRAMFYEADIDNSGYISMDELYNFFKLKLNADITKEELKNLVKEIDLDFDGRLDIDEFITLMTKNPGDKGGDNSAQSTYLRIRKSRKFDLTEFIKFLQKFPSHFQDSFTTTMYKNKKCLPSGAFIKNVFPSEGAPMQFKKKTVNPNLRTSESSLGGQILLESAAGIPYPEEDKVTLEIIKKRVVRVSIYDFDRKEFIGNSSHVVATVNKKNLDQWKFNKWSETGTNPLIFRSSDQIRFLKRKVCLIFEFVIYCQQDKKTVKELNCGWSKLQVGELDKKKGKLSLVVEGGSPDLDSEISLMDRKGKKAKKMTLSISYRGLKDFSDETLFHLSMMPDLCIFNKRLIMFLVGFRNFLGKERFCDTDSGQSVALPNNNFILVTFLKIMDNPDALETFLTYWTNILTKKMKDKEKYNISRLIEMAEENISKIYPVVYNPSFKMDEHNIHLAAECFPEERDLAKIRTIMIVNALNDKKLDYTDKNTSPIRVDDSYKPFNVRELDSSRVLTKPPE